MNDPIPYPAIWPPTIEHRRGADSIARHAAALRDILARPPQLRRGVVWVGGGDYWPGIVVGVRMLRETGCTLPVEVWHRGAIEPVDPVDVDGMGVRIVNTLAVGNAWADDRVFHTPYAGGWEAKLYALTHTHFDQVLFLDADAYCVRDPLPLFHTLTPSTPFAFWEDLPRMDGCVKWERVSDGDKKTPTVQGGQLLIDRHHGRKLLDAAHWICQHSDFYFAHVYGDQDAWRVGLAAGVCGSYNLGPADWRGVAFVCSLDGEPYIVHRCQSKLFAATPGPRDDTLPGEARVWEHFADVA